MKGSETQIEIGRRYIVNGDKTYPVKVLEIREDVIIGEMAGCKNNIFSKKNIHTWEKVVEVDDIIGLWKDYF